MSTGRFRECFCFRETVPDASYDDYSLVTGTSVVEVRRSAIIFVTDICSSSIRVGSEEGSVRRGRRAILPSPSSPVQCHSRRVIQCSSIINTLQEIPPQHTPLKHISPNSHQQSLFKFNTERVAMGAVDMLFFSWTCRVNT
jgi:hypothetical protein